MSTPAEIESTVTVMPPDVLDDVTRAQLQDAVQRHDPVVDARRWSRVAFFVMTLVVWFPTVWSGTKRAELAVQQWGAVIALTIGLHLVLATANRFAKENARAVLRRDSIARSILAAEQLAEQQAKLEAAQAKLKADIDKKAAAQKEADAKAKAEREAVEALADAMAQVAKQP
ncbi:hypothetical protein [Kineosporia sp. R_H_3]|uniref:hypothetical protein n=1 Tax=Kineosporia sp. R_H_3 TaxID=1961848 RepID=UPI000B4BD3A4|nr:hypothetical protein [Kineosporia sp. R_H_3]